MLGYWQEKMTLAYLVTCLADLITCLVRCLSGGKPSLARYFSELYRYTFTTISQTIRPAYESYQQKTTPNDLDIHGGRSSKTSASKRMECRK